MTLGQRAFLSLKQATYLQRAQQVTTSHCPKQRMYTSAAEATEKMPNEKMLTLLGAGEGAEGDSAVEVLQGGGGACEETEATVQLYKREL